jgi:hypothetical protein
MMVGESPAVWITNRLLRTGGIAVVLEAECGFDESGTHDGSPIVCVAGYVIAKEQMPELDREWNEVLKWDQLPHALPYFHMSDCAPEPGNGVFAGIEKPLRAEVAKRMIEIIKNRTQVGIAATVSVAEYESILTGHPFYPDPYVVAAHMVLQGVLRWIVSNPSVSRILYFFETGHRSRMDADALMQTLFSLPTLEEEYRYAGHSFIKKVGNPIVQAADILAWQWVKDRKNQLEGRRRRADLVSLLEHRHITVHLSADYLTRIAQTREPLIRVMSAILGGLSS